MILGKFTLVSKKFNRCCRVCDKALFLRRALRDPMTFPRAWAVPVVFVQQDAPFFRYKFSSLYVLKNRRNTQEVKFESFMEQMDLIHWKQCP